MFPLFRLLLVFGLGLAVQAAHVGTEGAGDPLDGAAFLHQRALGVQVVHAIYDLRQHTYLDFHAKKVENITQEIYARLIMYNFSELITSHVVIQKFERKHLCKANSSVAVQVCRQFLLGNVSPPDVEATIGRNLSVIRPGRNNPRNMVVKHAVSFLYRVA